MDNDNNPINSNWNVGTSANGGNENVLEEQSEHQPPAKKSRMDDPSSKEEPTEIAIQNDGATNEVQIRELEISTMDKKGELNELKIEMIDLKDEFAEKLSSLEEDYQKEIAELKLKNQKLTEEFEEKIRKLEERIQMNGQKIGEAENQIMVEIHEMKVQLPLENWHDLLAFVPRTHLGNVVSQIGDRQFAYIIQSFLHDPVREITLGYMSIIPPRRDVPTDQPVVHVWPNKATNMPDWPMPGNIKDFKGIDLSYVDTSVLNFLEKFQENFLLTDVNMSVDYLLRRVEVLPSVLTKIAPFITSINSITSPVIDLFYMVYKNNDGKNNNKSKLLLMEMMAKTRVLWIGWHCGSKCSWEDKMNWCCSWLYTTRTDGKPRMLKSWSNFYESTDCDSFIERIKKDFKMAKNPISFFIYTNSELYDNFEDTVENVKTNEKLVIKNMDDRKMLISRYPLNAAKTWIDTNEKEIFEWDPEELNRIINIDGELTITI